MSITEAEDVSKTPGKAYVYRMNSSFSKEGSVPKNSASTESNLPTIANSSNANHDKASLQEKPGNEKTKQPLKKDASKITKVKNQSDGDKIKPSLLKNLPKLSIDVPIAAKKFKFVNAYNDFDGKWIYRMMSREEYVRKDQVKNLDGYKNPKVVYDNMERSPYYTESTTPYFDEKKLIPVKESEAALQQQRFKNRGFRRAIVNTGVQK